MELELFSGEFSVCRADDFRSIDLGSEPLFIGKTDEEISVVCRTGNLPRDVSAREDGWRCFRIRGILDFSLTGILSDISGALAGRGIPVFAVSTFNTDYFLVKSKNLEPALEALEAKGYAII